MTPDTTPPASANLDDEFHLTRPFWTGPARLLTGLVQGLALYALYRGWNAKGWPLEQPMRFQSLLLLALFIPPVVISALTRVRPRDLLLWTLSMAAVIAGLGTYAVWQSDLGTLLDGEALAAWRSQRNGEWAVSAALFLGLVPAVFIAQAMMLAAQADGKYIARYARYFEQAWKLALQIAFAGLFMLLLWLVLQLGASLFGLIRLRFLRELLDEALFIIPVLATAFSFALHLTDVRPGIIDGIRKLLLSVLAWLLPLSVALVAGFLLSLALTGLEPLWKTRLASQVLLGATLLLVVLINVAYQDGSPAALPRGRIMSASLWLACLLPAPLTALAVYALGLRVAQYGWTADRIMLALAILVAAVYAIGYATAAWWRGPRLALIAAVNVGGSLLLLLLFVGVHSPLADPARLAVADQIARLKDGRHPADTFDYLYLRFDAGRTGVKALQAAAQAGSSMSETARTQAALALKHTVRSRDTPDTPLAPAEIIANIRMHPPGQALPAAFAQTPWGTAQRSQGPGCLQRAGVVCDGYLVAMPGEAAPQLLLFDARDTPYLFAAAEQGQWRLQGYLNVDVDCRTALKNAAAAGALQWLPSLRRDVVVNGVRLNLETPYDEHSRQCARPPAPAAAP